MIIYYNDEFSGGHAESRMLLEAAFAKHTGDAALARRLISELKTGDRGKPYIDGFSHFSVSHTGSLWAVLVAERECGLDIQLERECDMHAIAARVFAAEDREVLAQDREVPTQDLFFKIWTRREALAKAIGGSAFDSELPPVLNGRAAAAETEITGISGSSRDAAASYMIWDISVEDILRKQFNRVQAEAGAHASGQNADSDSPHQQNSGNAQRKKHGKMHGEKLYAAVCLKAGPADSEVPSGGWKAEVR